MTRCMGECKRPYTDVTRIAYQQVPFPHPRLPDWWRIRIILHDLQTCPDVKRLGLK